MNYTRGPGLALSDDIPGEIPGIFTPGIWEDYDFPYDLRDPAPESSDMYGGRDWELGENTQLYIDGVSYDDVRQGYVGDCSMMATIASVASLNPNFIRDAIVDNHNNTYTVRLYDSHGKAEYITVDGELYRDPDGTPVYARSRQLNEIWPAVIEKAYARWEGGYANIASRTATDTIMTLTGIRTHYTRNQQIPASMLYGAIRSSLANSSPVIASSYDDPSRYIGIQIKEDHAYSVLRVYEVNGQQWIVLRNPWGYYEYHGDYKAVGRDDGVFSMKIEDYCRLFQGTTLSASPVGSMPILESS
ncbi:MAG: C2 family cysteine protease [Candidatus Thiodiazotropha sp.]